ncbi:hypothetical protein EV178_003355 [Coemansia sp. RSA 1646]|nr:hypothetical protein EV178_003355 [Coemansia sp. RSA 1646]KAJ2085472.1 hypothetical protein IW138_006307 [Coemansia sp. RSA 986]
MDLGFYVPDLTGNTNDGERPGERDNGTTTAGAPNSQQPSLEEIASAARAAAAGLVSSSIPLQQQNPIIPPTAFPTSIPGFSSDPQQSTLFGAAAAQQEPVASSSNQAQPGSKDANGGPAKPIGMACRACRLRKIRCGGERPRCTYCVKKGYECVLTPHKKRGRPRKNSQRGKQQHEGTTSDKTSDQPDMDDIPLATATGLNKPKRNTTKTTTTTNTAYEEIDEEEDDSSGMRAMKIPENNAQSGGDMMLDGLDIDVRQLWAELTGLQGLDLPPELSALAANSAIQPIDTYPSSIPSIGPSFNLGITQPSALHILAQQPNGNGSSMGGNTQIPLQPMSSGSATRPIPPPLPLYSTAATDSALYQALPLAGDGNMAILSAANLSDANLFASNYAFPRQAGGPGSASPLTTPRPHQEPHERQHQPIRSPVSSAVDSNAHLSPNAAEEKQARLDTSSSADGHTTTATGTTGTTGRKNPTARARSTSSSAAAEVSLPTIRQTIDEGVRMYFVYVHPWLPILHRPTFERQITEGHVDPILYYAVQAVAARFKDRDNSSAFAAAGSRSAQQQTKSNQQGSFASSVRKPYKRGQRYARAARSLLPESLRNARLSTLQAITIMALYMSVSGHWQEGAAYERLAVQLAFIGQYHLLDEEFLLPPVTNNMGLYESGWSEHSHPARLEVLSRPGGVLEHEQRRRAWWSIFQLERFNGLAMGRPPIIKPGWHWVWLPCSEDLWARDNPSGALAWEMGLADFSQRPSTSVSNCRVDLILALVMGQLIDQRTELFRLFFPRVDRGTLFYDNLPTHSLTWPVRLRKLCDAVTVLERRIRQWHAELDRYADTFSARRHANFEIMGASCQIHLFACVLQIREHLFEDLLVSEEARAAIAKATATASAATEPVESNDTDDDANMSDRASSRNSSSVDMATVFERHTGVPFDRSTYQRGYVAKAKRPEMSLQFVHDLDTLAQRCWDRSVSMADEIARLLRVHWLRPFEQQSVSVPNEDDDTDLVSFISSNIDGESSKTKDQQQQQQKQRSSTSSSATHRRPSVGSGGSASSAAAMGLMDPQIADRFKLMNPQTPYHLFVAGKVQAARLKQAVTAQQSARRKKNNKGSKESPTMMDVDNADNTNSCNASSEDYSPEVVADAIKRINDIWDSHGLAADAKLVAARLDDIIAALEYCQLFWNSLNFASHLRYLKREAAKPLLSAVFRE